MAYVCNLGNGQNIYLDNPGEQTVVMSMIQSPSQQQQSSSSFHTGTWTEIPQVFQTSQGLMIKIMSVQGDILIQVQGQNMQVTQNITGLPQSQKIPVSQTDSMPKTELLMTPMTPMPPISPLKPIEPMTMKPMSSMKLGDMQMNPMQMQMGDMQMQMGKAPSMEPSAPKPRSDHPRKFCTQCGQAIEASDRFCGSCGHSLTT